MALKLLTLMRLTASQPIVDKSTGYPTAAYQRLQNDQAANEQAIVNAIVEQVNEITTALNQAGIATSSASSAQTAASNALTATEAVRHEMALVTSYVDPNIITASIDPADATKAIVTISAHTRYYGDQTSVSVSGGTVTGQPLSTTLYVYYLDPTRSGGSVSYILTPTMRLATQGGDRHTVGVITTPDSGGASVTGKSTLPPGIPGGFAK